jgi:hypothetical protein
MSLLLRHCMFFLCLLVCLFYSLPVAAAGPESTWVRNNDGHEVFRLDFFGKGQRHWSEEPEWGLEPEWYFSAGDFSLAAQDDIVRAADYWTAVLKPHGAPANPVILRLFVNKDTDYNAAAIYFENPDDPSQGALWSSLVGHGSPPVASGLPDDLLVGAHGLVTINNFVWDTQGNSNVLETESSLDSTIIHEIGHALGITEDSQKFAGYLGTGGTATSGYTDRTPYDPDHPEDTGGYLNFYGPKTMQVFGRPVPMAHASYDSENHEDGQEESHFGLRNGRMTHCQIVNYPMFMEVELAALADIGYPIDLRNFFGKSLYDDYPTNPDVVFKDGFFASQGLDANQDWLGYDEHRPNISPFGVGLHIYGSNYNVSIEEKDLLADGAGGAGIRVDGFYNTVTIAPDIAVTGNGRQGTGLLVAFGSEHTITSRGDIIATGPLGIGARFDFGAPYEPYKDKPLHSYGKYFLNEEGVGYPPNDGAIDGPLVENFHLSGLLAGGPSAAQGQYLSGEFVNYEGRPIALYIGWNAHVKNINVLNGASIHGDIISRWNPAAFSLSGPGYMTDLTFGRMADINGNALADSSDANFRLHYRGDILGAESMNVHLAGGELNYAGTMRVHSFSMDEQTRLLIEFNNGNASIIAAGDNVSLASGSAIGFAPSPFSYGPQLALGGNAVLRFTQSVPAEPALLPSAGTFSMGAFDYQWDGLYWDAATGAVMPNITGKAFNDMRGSTDARNAQLALTARTPGLDAVGTRMVRRFGSVGAHSTALQGTALSLLGRPEANMGTFWSQGRPFATRTGFTRDPIQTGAGPAASSVNWLALNDGGWEAGTPRWGMWVAPSYDYLNHRGNSSYTVRGTSITSGFDHFFTETFYMGLAVSLDYPRYDSDNAEVDGNGITGILYGGMLLPLAVEIGFNASYGGMHCKQERTVDQRAYQSDYNTRTLNFGTGIGRRFALAAHYALRPFADWNYFYSKNASHFERADIYGLQYESVHKSIHRLQAGLEGVWAVDDAHLGLKAYWSGLRGDTGGTSASSFVLDPAANRFTAPMDGLDRDSIGLGVSAGVRLGGDMELRLEYSLLAGETTTAQQGMVGLRYTF